MSCPNKAKQCDGAMQAAGVPETVGTWAGSWKQGQGHCPKCGGFMTNEGGCNNPDCGAKRAYMQEVMSGNYLPKQVYAVRSIQAENYSPMVRGILTRKLPADRYAQALVDVVGGREWINVSQSDLSMVMPEDLLRADRRLEFKNWQAQSDEALGSDEPPKVPEFIIHDKQREIELVDRSMNPPLVVDEFQFRDEEAFTVASDRARQRNRKFGEIRDRQRRRRMRSYFDSEIEQVDPDWLDGFKASPGFSRKDGEKILESIRQGAIDKLSNRRFDSNEAMGRAVTAINASTLKHTAQVMVMATKIAAVTGADEQTARTAGLAAGYHDSGKDDTNFVYHHLAGAEFAERALRETGLSNDDSEIANVKQAIMEHMPFGDGDNPNNFMNAALAGEAAAIAKTSGQGWEMRRVPNEVAARLLDDDVEKEFSGGGSLGTATIDGVPVTFSRDENYRIRKESVMYDSESRRKLRYLMVDALQKDGAAVERVESWLATNAGQYKAQGELAKAMQAEFGGRELSYPKPSSDAARILSDAATASGEHLGEARRGPGGRSMLETSYSAGEITWAADGLMLSSAESLSKIVDIHQKQWGKAGTEPIVVSMASAPKKLILSVDSCSFLASPA